MSAPSQILAFEGDYHFLSNFHVEEFAYNGTTYASGEHAFQALKAADRQGHDYVRAAPTPGIAKRRGRAVQLRHGWDNSRDGVMLAVLRAKFAPGTRAAARLLATGSARLVEGNTWGDRYWGVCRGVGRNKLGVLLMQVRQELVVAAGGAAGQSAPNATETSHADLEE